MYWFETLTRSQYVGGTLGGTSITGAVLNGLFNGGSISNPPLLASSNGTGFGFMFVNYYNAAVYWLQQINTNLVGILAALGGETPEFTAVPTYGLWIPLFDDDLTTSSPLAMDYSDYQNVGPTYALTNGISDLRLASAMTNFGLGLSLAWSWQDGVSAYYSRISPEEIVLDLSQYPQDQAMLNGFDANYIPYFTTSTAAFTPPSTLGGTSNFIQANIQYYSSAAQLAPMNAAQCGPNDIVIQVNILPGTAKLQKTLLLPYYVTLQLKTLIGSLSTADSSPTWLETGSINIHQMTANPTQYSFTCEAVATSGSSSTGSFILPCTISLCLNSAQLFRPSLLMPQKTINAAPTSQQSVTVTSRLTFPNRGLGAFGIGMNPIFYNQYVPGGNAAVNQPSASLSPSGYSGELGFYLCTTQTPLLGVKLAKGSIKFNGGVPGSMQSLMTTLDVAPGPPILNLFMEWLDIDWDEEFNNRFATAQWGLYQWDTEGTTDLYIVTDLDVISCTTTPSTTVIPQSLWALRLEFYVPQ